MNTKSKYFPHPVLGSSTDVDGSVILQLEIDRNDVDHCIVFRIIKCEVINDYFNKLLVEKKAGLLYKVYCSSTFNTFNFLNPTDEFRINENEICNKLEIEPLIVSLSNLDDYRDSSFDSDFEGTNFEVVKYDILGILGKITVPLDDKFEKQGIGNLFVFEPLEDSSLPLSFDFTLDKIHIKYPPTKDGEHPPNGMFHKAAWTAFNVFIVPALTEAFRIIQSSQLFEDAKDLEWCQVLSELLPENERDNDPFASAQLVLEGEIPLLKSYDELCKN